MELEKEIVYELRKDHPEENIRHKSRQAGCGKSIGSTHLSGLR